MEEQGELRVDLQVLLMQTVPGSEQGVPLIQPLEGVEEEDRTTVRVIVTIIIKMTTITDIVI